MYDRLKVWLMLSPALAVIFLLFMSGLIFGLGRSLNYMPIIGLNEPNLDAYRSIFTSREFLRSAALTFYIALTSTFISMVLAIVAGLVLRQSYRGKKLMSFLFQFNLPIPHIVGAVAILFLFSQSGFMARIAYVGGLIERPMDFPVFVRDPYALGIIMEYVWKEVPFIGIVVLAVLQSVGQDYEELARTLGASRWQRFRYVLLPLIMPGVLSVSVIVLAFTFGAFEIPFILGQTFPTALPVLAVRSYTDADLRARPEAMAMAMVIAVMSTILIFIYMSLTRRYVRSE